MTYTDSKIPIHITNFEVINTVRDAFSFILMNLKFCLAGKEELKEYKEKVAKLGQKISELNQKLKKAGINP